MLNQRRASFDHGSRRTLYTAQQAGLFGSTSNHPTPSRLSRDDDSLWGLYKRHLRRSAEVVTAIATVAGVLLLMYLHTSFVGKVRRPCPYSLHCI